MGRTRKEGGLEQERQALRNFDVPIRRRFYIMLKRLFTTLFSVVVLAGLTSVAIAQYIKVLTDNPTDNTRFRATGTTILSITLDTTHDRDGSVQSCNSHTDTNSA